MKGVYDKINRNLADLYDENCVDDSGKKKKFVDNLNWHNVVKR